MKIGIDARMYRSGVAGIGRYSQNLIKNLLEIDHDDEFVLFMTPKDREEFENYFIENSLKIENLKLKIVVADIPHFSLAEQIKLPKILEKEKLDLMHFLNFNYPVRYKQKFMVTIHDLTLFFFPETARDTNIFKRLGFRYVMKNACRNSQAIIAPSENTKKDIIKIFQVPVAKIKVIYEAADDKVFTNKAKYQIDLPVILYVGQFRRHKNLIGLIKGFELLQKDCPCQLAILGRTDAKREIQSILDKSAYNKDIVMPGFVSDKELVSWYKIASVFVLPSFYEGFGLPGLEAMQAGTPVVASNRASLPEIYQDAALYFDPFDPADIAAKIKMVLTNKKLRRDLIAKGQKMAKKYSWRKTAEETLDLYKQIQKSEILNSKSETNSNI